MSTVLFILLGIGMVIFGFVGLSEKTNSPQATGLAWILIFAGVVTAVVSWP